MTTVLLVRHGRTAANAGGILAGWTPGVVLDDRGQQQARDLGARLSEVPLAAIVSSPLERTMETASLIAQGRTTAIPVQEEPGLAEVRYGDWTGRSLKELAREPLWRTVQQHPSAVTFPGPEGESMAAMAARAVAAVRTWNERLGPDAVYVAVSHGDVIKAVIADALGLHLDQFQRLHVDPCSMSVITYTDHRPFVMRVNDIGGSLSGLVPAPRGRRSSRGGGRGAGVAPGDAVVGGGAGA